MGISTLLQKLAAQQAVERPKGQFYRFRGTLRYAKPSKKGLAKKQAKAAVKAAAQAVKAAARQAKADEAKAAREAKRALPPKNPRIAAIAKKMSKT